MFKDKKKKDEPVVKPIVEESMALDLDNLEEVTGGAGLRNVAKVETSKISDSTKSKI